MVVLCYKCGAENWLENEAKCHACSAILRRCIDCESYSKPTEQCAAHRVEIDVYEAEHPSLLGTSTACRAYRPAPGGAVKVKAA